MAWTYDVTTLQTSVKDQIRLYIGDTDPDNPMLQDEEIEFYISQYPDNVLKATLQCVNSVLSRLASIPSYTLGPYSEDNSDRISSMETLKAEIEKQTFAAAPFSKSTTTDPLFIYNLFSRKIKALSLGTEESGLYE